MSHPIDIYQYLSRFFFAANGDELREAYLALAAVLPLSTVDDWDAVEFCFNHLFVGPAALLAPPYASIYLDGDDARLMGASSEKMRRLYEMVGLASPWLNKIPDDHLALELDALWQIEYALQKIDSRQLYEARQYLLAHLWDWMPKFIARVQAVQDVHPAISGVVSALRTTLPRPEALHSKCVV
jgi:TorA maturation chaperone TorD